jgi:glucose/arabinose dehydrogenase
VRPALAAVTAAALAIVVGLSTAAAGAAGTGGLTLVPVASFTQPVGMAVAPGDPSRLFVVEKGGRIVVRHGAGQSTFLDLTGQVKSDGYEQGLLGLSFAPDYASSGRFYVYYTASTSAPGAASYGSDLAISEFRRGADADHADPASERPVLRIPHRLEEFENGGQMRFGPDGLLWIGTGDGGGDGDPHRNAQRLDPATDDAAAGADALLGKILRIDPTPGDGCGGACTIPAGNPGFAQREVWAYGLRNPWRFSFDRLTGDLAIADVGNRDLEEVDLAPAPGLGRGANFGWPYFEAGAQVSPSRPVGCCLAPVIQKSHRGDGFDALIGGMVVRDPGLPSLEGRYVYAALTTGEIRSARFAGGRAVDDRDTGLRVPNLTSFGEDACGRVFATTIDGGLYRISQGTGACSAVGMTLTAAARQRVSGAAGTVEVTVTCAAGCTVRARGSLLIGGGGGSLAGHTGTLTRQLAAGRRTVLRFRIGAALRRSVAAAARRSRGARLRFEVTARAGAGGPARHASASSRLVR